MEMTSRRPAAHEVPQQRGPLRRAAGRLGREYPDGELVDHVSLTIPAPARQFQGRPAGVVSRLLANAIDLLVTVAIVALGYLGASGFLFLWQSTAFSFPTFGRTAIVVSAVAVLWIYLTVAWSATGRTYGDHVVGLLVVGRAGRPLGIVRAAARASACLAFPIGLLWCALSPRSASVQDVVLGTSVVYAWEGSRLRRLGQPEGRIG